MNVLIIDSETTGLDSKKDVVIEVGAVLWSVKHRTMIECFSAVLNAEKNPAENVNGIPPAMLAERDPDDTTCWVKVAEMACEAGAFVAHGAQFDKDWCGLEIAEHDTGAAKAWVCTIEDFVWPKPTPSRSLVSIALAHGVGVVAAHRAINDCLTLVRLFEALPDVDARISAAMKHAQLPRARVVARAPFEQKDIVKAHGFHWDPQRREWWRVMAKEDMKELPFAAVAMEDAP